MLRETKGKKKSTNIIIPTCLCNLCIFPLYFSTRLILFLFPYDDFVTCLWDCGFTVTLSNWKHIILTQYGFLNFQLIFLGALFPLNFKA